PDCAELLSLPPPEPPEPQPAKISTRANNTRSRALNRIFTANPPWLHYLVVSQGLRPIASIFVAYALQFVTHRCFEQLTQMFDRPPSHHKCFRHFTRMRPQGKLITSQPDHLSVDVCRFIAGKINDDRGHFLRLAASSDPRARPAGVFLLADFFGDGLHHVGQGSRNYGVHGNVVFGKFLANRPGESHDPRFGRGVVRLADIAAQPRTGRNVDDPPALLLAHVLGSEMGAGESPLQMNRDDVIPFL